MSTIAVVAPAKKVLTPTPAKPEVRKLSDPAPVRKKCCGGK
jgi:hypothetical protein